MYNSYRFAMGQEKLNYVISAQAPRYNVYQKCSAVIQLMF